jgi:hypothetical protein
MALVLGPGTGFRSLFCKGREIDKCGPSIYLDSYIDVMNIATLDHRGPVSMTVSWMILSLIAFPTVGQSDNAVSP